MGVDLDALHSQAHQYARDHQLPPHTDRAAYATWYCYNHQEDQLPHREAAPLYVAEMASYWADRTGQAELIGDDEVAREARERRDEFLAWLGTLLTMNGNDSDEEEW